ncbi:unnamed protein product [Didymodactylos carnosus]|uniref:Uncharacterized protein n=1 Tax=Didymodactylos carnosus TaxID=1234261 RepID=A0A8S2HD01_9BILA|nr:unnamed protein product [Didymodactylos carnosus]CAF3629895.1 unnamed protein product [Didymodactylos carnosus]
MDVCTDENQQLLKQLIPFLLLHIALLIKLSIIDRYLKPFPKVNFSPLLTQLIQEFQQILSLNLSKMLPDLSYTKIADMFDGRLFAFTLYTIMDKTQNFRLDTDTYNILKRSFVLYAEQTMDDNVLVDALEQMILTKNITFGDDTSLIENTTVIKRITTLTKISNPLIDTYLQPISSEIVFTDVENHSSMPEYKGKFHWHVYKEVGSEIDRVRDNSMGNKSKNYRFRTKNTQLYYQYMTLYGKSLTSRDIKDSNSKIVLPTLVINTNGNDKQDRQKKIHKTKAEKIIEGNDKKKNDKRVHDESERMTTIESMLKRLPNNNFIQSLEIIDNHLPSFQSKRLEILKLKLVVQRKYLKYLKQQIKPTCLEQLQIGYFATLTEIAHLENSSNNPWNEKEKYMKELIDDNDLAGDKWFRFQMNTINSRVPRLENGKADPRVADFIPDDWQVEFLNAVDQKQSIIIVAPTASGKTYASYYAMKSVIKEDDIGICVYVAPTKALVNQVSATIYSKFGAVFGVFTRDYRTNVENSRILVTIPQCFEILLLSPQHQQWCNKIRYVIFDEIHCMSGEADSDVWEKNMLLINCPMIVLRDIRFISYNERMADLNKYLYSEKQLHPIHPIQIMDSKQLIDRGCLPKDFALSPKETLQLSDAIQKTSEIASNVTHETHSSVSKYFANDWIMERWKCNDYSRSVCNNFQSIVKEKGVERIDSIITNLNEVNPSLNANYPEGKKMSTLIVDFVLTLREKNLLPCIVFSDSRHLVELMAESVSSYFEQQENHLRETKYKTQIQQIEKRLLQTEKNRKLVMKRTSKSSATGNAGNDNRPEKIENDENELHLSGIEQDLLYGVLPECTLANTRDCDKELVDSLITRASNDNSTLVKYMRRGVAYHHAGLANKGRIAVEALYRNRYVQIVFSTSTLALGIHMPTKSVGFLKDSIYLDALQYRQSSGRAGRRGFDVEGHVIFIDIPLSKIRHLTISAIPNIHPHFPTSVTFWMRLLHLYSKSQDKQDAKNRVLVALECSFASSTSKHILIDIQTRYHCLYTLEFLHRLNLIDLNGHLMGLAGLSTHLHYFEPSNILLIYLMDTHLFHSIQSDDTIITVLAYLFTHLPWHISDQQYQQLIAVRREKTFNSKLFLSPITEEFRQRITSFNDIVKDVYGYYIENVIIELRKRIKNENILPFSDVSFHPSTNENFDNGSFEYNLHHHHSQQQSKTSISPFAGISGLTHQTFMTNYNGLSWDLAYDLDLSNKIVPFVNIDSVDHTGQSYRLNSYAYDFFRHGNEESLISENQLERGDAYNVLLDFRLVLSSIKTSLEIIIDCEKVSTDLQFFKPLYEKIQRVEQIYSNNFYNQYPGRN